MKIPKITGTQWALVSTAGVVIILLIVLFRSCKPIPKDNTQAIIDSITNGQKAREDSLSAIIDSVSAAAEIATENADNFYLESEKQKDRAKIAGIHFEGLKKKYETLKAAHDSTAFDAADSAIGAAQDQITKLDSTVKIKDRVITEQKTAYYNLKQQLTATKQSREGFKQDFMKLQTGVVFPLQAQLKNANKQWAANRFWKKTFAGVAATAIIYGAIQTFK